MSITWDDVTARAPELSTLAVNVQNAILEDVGVLLNASILGDKYKMAACYLAAHLGTVSKNGALGPSGPITSESAGPVSRSYAQPSKVASAEDYNSTSYGQRYLGIIGTLPERWNVL